MGALRFLLGLAAAAAVHMVASRITGHFAVAVDLFLVVALYVARSGHLPGAIAAGSVAGWVTDALTGGPFGLFGFADTIVAYVTAFASRRLVIERPLGIFLLHVLAVAVQQGLVAGLLGALSSDAELPGLPAVGLRMAATGVVGTLVAIAAQRFLRRLRGDGSRRRSKLRLGS